MECQTSNSATSISLSEAGEAFIPLLHKALLGDLTASLLHEINNPITAILNYARLVQLHGVRAEEFEEIAGSIVAEGERIAELTRRITPLARPKSLDGRGANLNDALELAIYLYKTRFRHDGIAVEIQSGQTLPDTKLFMPDLIQIILPLLEEARQALNARGFSSETNKIIRCRLSQINVDKNNWQRLTLIHNGIQQNEVSVNLFRHLYSNVECEEQIKLAATITQALLEKLDCKIGVERQTDGWMAMHLYLPAEI